MNDEPCRLLEDFLDGTLGATERASFEAHLATCTACRPSAEEEASLRQLLQRAVAELQPVPHDLARRFKARLLRERQRRVRLWWAGLVAAAGILLAIALGTFGRGRLSSERSSSPLAPQTLTRLAPKDSRSRVEVVVSEEKDLIAVPLPTGRPNVTIVWFYPAVHADQHQQTSNPLQ